MSGLICHHLILNNNSCIGMPNDALFDSSTKSSNDRGIHTDDPNLFLYVSHEKHKEEELF